MNMNISLGYDLQNHIQKLAVQTRIDCIHDILTMDNIPIEIRDELRGILANTLIEQLLDDKYQIVKETVKKPKQPRKKAGAKHPSEAQSNENAPEQSEVQPAVPTSDQV